METSNIVSNLKLALDLHQAGNLSEAKKLYEEVLLTDSQKVVALQMLGLLSAQIKDFPRALTLLTEGLILEPTHWPSFNNLGNVLSELKLFSEALESYENAILLNPTYSDAYNNKGNILEELNRPIEALECYAKAITIKPNYAEALYNAGSLLQKLGKHKESLEHYNKAIASNPRLIGAHINKGNLLRILSRHEDALASYRNAISQNQNSADAYNNIGATLKELKRHKDALNAYQSALEISPRSVETYCNVGNLLQAMGLVEAALEYYDIAIGLNPNHADAHNGKSGALKELKRHEEALSSLRVAAKLDPKSRFVYSNLVSLDSYVCDWENLSKDYSTLKEQINDENELSDPFCLLPIADDPLLHKKSAELYIQNIAPSINTLSLANVEKNFQRKKIHIGYFSSDFHNHATAHLISKLFECHNKEQFELTAFSFGPVINDDTNIRIRKAFDNFLHVDDKSDQEIAEISRNMKIDIAIDLKGFTKHNRIGIFSYRAAPIQINYLGYPGTLGSNYIDYIIADESLITPDTREYYLEHVIFLPNSYQVNDDSRLIDNKKFERIFFDLPEKAFVFCCFNNNYKITDTHFQSWVRILKNVDESVIWLLEDNQLAAANLRNAAKKYGLDPNRLIFTGRLPPAEHLARHCLADLFLDTYPCNAHTTCSDALWSGLPVLTLAGKTFASRVGASLLNAIDMPELITFSPEEYEQRAINIATNNKAIHDLKKKLSSNRISSSLFNTNLFTHLFENALREAYRLYKADLPLRDIKLLP